MKKLLVTLLTVIIALSGVLAINTSAASVMKSGNFNSYTWNDGEPMKINGKGQFVSDGFAWKLSEFKQAPTGNFTIEADILTQDGTFNDSVNFYQHKAAFFAVAGYDKSDAFGVFFNTRVSGMLEVYMCKWSNGVWRGYMPLNDGADSYIFDSVLDGAGDEITLKTKISVSGNTVKVNATVEGTGKKIDECVFDLSKQFNGETKVNEVQRDGTVAFTTQRMTEGAKFANIKIADSTGVLEGVVEDTSSNDNSSSEETSSSDDTSNDEKDDSSTPSSDNNENDTPSSSEKDNDGNGDNGGINAITIVVVVLAFAVGAGAGVGITVLVFKSKQKRLNNLN